LTVNARTFSLVAGMVYLAIGLFGLVPVTLVPPPADAPPTSFAMLYGHLFGLFPTNVLHTALHVGIGFWGLCAWSERCSAVAYCRAVAVLFAVLAVLGVIPGLNTLFGAMPIYGHDVWLHAVTALGAASFAEWRAPQRVHERRRTGSDRRIHALPVARERRLGLADRRESFAAMHPA
jgi:hypothetical protein